MADHYFGNNDTVNEFLQYLIAEVITEHSAVLRL